MSDQTAEEVPVTCACGRLLTDPVSIARGLGRVCWRKVHDPPARRSRRTTAPAAPGPEQAELPLDDQLPLWSST